MLGIVLLNYNSFEDTKKCVESIVSTIVNIKYKIFIIDNNSPDKSYEKLRAEYNKEKLIQVIQSGKNGGYSYGNNIGIRLAIKENCDAILISNTDIIYYENSIESMYTKLRSNNVGVVGPNMINGEGVGSQIKISPPSLKNYWKTKKPISLLYKNHHKPKNYEKDDLFRGMVQGSSFVIDADLIMKVGYLDEKVFLFGEELILAHKLNTLEIDTLIDSDALILHDHSTTISKEGEAFERLHMYYSTIYVLKKYEKTSNFVITFPILYNLLFYSFKSIQYNSYKERLKSFTKKILSIYSV